MADNYLTLQTTPAGMNMIVRSLYGDQITFTRIVIGNGHPASLNNVTALAHQMLSVGITASETGTDHLILTGDISSTDIPVGFYGYELGVYARGGDNVEHLYAYRHCTDDVDYYPSSESGRTLELTLSIVVQLGNAQNVTAILVEGDAYARVDHTHSADDIVSGTLPEARGGTGASSFENSNLAKVRAVKLTAGGWGYSVPYTQEVTVSGMRASYAPVIAAGMPDTINAENIKVMRKAYGMIDRAVTGTNKITFYCYGDRPAADINLLIKGV